MAKVGMTIMYGTGLDLTGVRDGIAKVQQTIESKPLELNIKTAGDLTSQLGDERAFFAEMEAGAVNVQKLRMEYAQFQQISTGKTLQIATAGFRELRGATGEVITQQRLFNQVQVETLKASKDYKQLGVDTAIFNVGTAAKKAETDVTGMKKSLDANTVSADKFLAKSKNMSGQQVEDARKVALAIKAEKTEFDRLFAKKDWDNAAISGQKIKDLSGQFEILKSATAAGANVFQSWAERMGNAIKQTISYGLSIQMVQKAQQLLNDAVSYAIDLNTQMTKIQVLQTEGAQTPEQINALAQSFNNLGMAMGASTLEIAKGSVEWLRQGRTVEETQKLMIASLQLGKLGAMDAADATNYLTSIMFAFKKNADEATTVVDKLIAVDNIAATSAGELATAMRYTSESAQIAGVSMEQLISYLGTVSSVTRQNAEMIGQAFKTIFARMTLMQGGGLDEFGVSISKVEKSLHAVGIEVRNTDDTFKPMGNVLETLADRWNTLTTRQQIEIATAVGGIRQKELFLVLMQNMDKAYKYQAAQVDSLGLAQQRYGIYLESVQAKQGQFTAAMEALKIQTINSNMVKWFLDAAISIVKFITAAGGIPPLLVEIITLMVLFNRTAIIKTILSAVESINLFVIGLKNYITNLYNATLGNNTYTISQRLVAAAAGQSAVATNVASVAMEGAAGAALTLNAALGILGIAAVAISFIWQAYQKHLANVKQAQDDAAESVQNYIDKINAIPSTVKSAETAIQTIIDLLNKKEKGTATADELEQLKAAFLELYKLLPQLDWAWVDGSPQLTLTQLAAIKAKDAIEQMLGTQGDLNDFITNLGGQTKAYNDVSEAIEKATGKQKALLAVQEAGAKTPAQAKAAIATMDTTGWSKEAMEGVREAYKFVFDETWFGKLREDFGSNLNTAIIGATSDIASNTATQKDIGDKFSKLMSLALGSGKDNPVLKAFLEWAESSADPTVQALLVTAKKQFLNAQGEMAAAERKLTEQRHNFQLEATKETILSGEEIEAAYEKEIAVINKISPALNSLNALFKKTNASSTEFQNAVLELNQQLEELSATTPGLENQIKTMDQLMNASGTALDPVKVSNYRDALLNWLATNSELRDSNSALYNLLKQQLDDLKGVAKETLVSVTDTTGQMFVLVGSQSTQFAQLASQALWNLAGNATEGIRFTATNGQEIIVYSAEQIQIAMEKGYISFTNFIQQATARAGENGATLAKYFSDILGKIRSGSPFLPSVPTLPGGGGGGGKTPEQLAREASIKAIEDKIKNLNKQKDALQDELEGYKEYISLQKESLKRAKEEADFTDELAKKHKSLGRLKAEIAMLGLDDSEEAQKRKLELEEEAGGLEEEITQDTENRKYDLQIQALDDLQDAFEKNIEVQIKAIDNEIDKLNDEKDAIQDLNKEVGGGGAAAWGTNANAAKEYDAIVKTVVEKVNENLGSMMTELGLANTAMQKLIESWVQAGNNEEQAYKKAQAYLNLLKEIETYELTLPAHWEGPYPAIHQGGLIESHHGGEFAGNLMSNEIFAKLLKGEYVATENQMDNFLKNILPKVANGIISPITQSRYSNENTGDTYFDMKVIVTGSLDKSVLPDLKESVTKVLNETLERWGIKRTASSFSI